MVLSSIHSGSIIDIFLPLCHSADGIHQRILPTLLPRHLSPWSGSLHWHSSAVTRATLLSCLLGPPVQSALASSNSLSPLQPELFKTAHLLQALAPFSMPKPSEGVPLPLGLWLSSLRPDSLTPQPCLIPHSHHHIQFFPFLGLVVSPPDGAFARAVASVWHLSPLLVVSWNSYSTFLKSLSGSHHTLRLS